MEALLVIFGVIAFFTALILMWLKWEKKCLKLNHEKTVKEAQQWLEEEFKKKDEQNSYQNKIRFYIHY